MIKQECIGIPDMILLLMIFCFKKIKIKAEIVLSPGGAYFVSKPDAIDNKGFYYLKTTSLIDASQNFWDPNVTLYSRISHPTKLHHDRSICFSL